MSAAKPMITTMAQLKELLYLGPLTPTTVDHALEMARQLGKLELLAELKHEKAREADSFERDTIDEWRGQ
jgi:hypothetical protein